MHGRHFEAPAGIGLHPLCKHYELVYSGRQGQQFRRTAVQSGHLSFRHMHHRNDEVRRPFLYLLKLRESQMIRLLYRSYNLRLCILLIYHSCDVMSIKHCSGRLDRWMKNPKLQALYLAQLDAVGCKSLLL